MSFRSGGRGGANQIFQVFGFVNVNQVVYTFEVPIAINNTNIIVLARGSGCQLGGQKDNWGGGCSAPPTPLQREPRFRYPQNPVGGWRMRQSPTQNSWGDAFPPSLLTLTIMSTRFNRQPSRSSLLIAWCSAPSDICSRCR